MGLGKRIFRIWPTVLSAIIRCLGQEATVVEDAAAKANMRKWHCPAEDNDALIARKMGPSARMGGHGEGVPVSSIQ